MTRANISGRGRAEHQPKRKRPREGSFLLRAVDRGQGGVAPLSRSEATLKPRRGQTTIVCVADNSGFEPPLKKVAETPEACYTISQGNIPR